MLIYMVRELTNKNKSYFCDRYILKYAIMKKILHLVIYIFFINVIVSQEITTVINIEFPMGIAIDSNNDDIYVGAIFDGRVKANLNESFPLEYIDFDPGFMENTDLAIHNNNLYIAQLDGSNIYKIDLSENPPNRILYKAVSGLNGLAVKDNYLYFSTFFEGSIQRINLLENDPMVETIVSGFTLTTGITILGDELFFCDDEFSNQGNHVYKINLNDVNPVPVELANSSTIHRPTGIAIDGTNLYVSELVNNRISRIDLADNNTVAVVLENVSNPRDIDIYDGYLYIAESSANEVTRVELSQLMPLSVNEIKNANTPKIFPNPTNGTFEIEMTGLEDETEYTIYNLLGKKVSQGFIGTNNKVNVENLSKGVYFLKLSYGQILKFVVN